MKRISVTRVLSVCSVLGCGSARAPVTPAPAQPAPVAAQVAPSANPAEAKPAPAAAEAQASPFHIVATGVSLFPTEGGLMYYNGSDMLAEIQGDTITPHPEYLGTYIPEPFSNLEVIGGAWPKHGIIAVARAAARSSYTTLYEKQGNGWRSFAVTPVGEWYAGVQPWSKGRSIALVLSMGFSYRWAVVSGPRGTLPKPAVLPPVPDERPAGVVRSHAIAFAALQSGDLFALGQDQLKEDAWAVERWAPDKAVGVVDSLPGAGELAVDAAGIVAIAANDAFVYGSLHNRKGGYDPKASGSYLAHFDGKTWSSVPVADNAGITSLAATSDAIWAASDHGLYKQTRGSTSWVPVALPSDAQVRVALASASVPATAPVTWTIKQVYVDASNVVWLGATAASNLDMVILRSKPSSAVWHAPAGSKWTQSVQQFRPYRAADQTCEFIGSRIFVMLYAATKSTPKDYDYPLTRAALKGHTEFAEVEFAETEEFGRHYFGAFVPELSIANRLVKVVEAGVKGSKPVALCRDPKRVRILGIDLKTGNVTSNKPAPQVEN